MTSPTYLRDEGHTVATTRELELTAETDHMQLLTAYRREAIMVTHNRRDFTELHGAWLAWSREWGVSVRHSGIVVVPQEESGELWTAPIIAARLLMLLGEDLPRANELYHWRTGRWLRRP